MKENGSHWQARIGSLKGLALIVGLLAVIFLWAFGLELRAALDNPTEPQPVSIGQLVRGEVGQDRYVSISGTAYYELGYIETEDEKEVANVYPLVDDATGDMFFVRTTEPVLDVGTEAVTVTGMTAKSQDLLRDSIEADLPLIEEAGLTTTANLYLDLGEKPGSAGGLIAAVAGLALVLVLCIVMQFFPSVVFQPGPVSAAAGPAAGDLVPKATGRFHKLKRLEPSIELGRGTHRFREANANLVPLEGWRLMVHIHYIQRRRVYGITLFKQKSDWAVLLDPARTSAVEPGKLLGWRDRWAARIPYQDDAGTAQVLFLSFDTAGAQARVLDALQEIGFAVASGAPAPAPVQPALGT